MRTFDDVIDLVLVVVIALGLYFLVRSFLSGRGANVSGGSPVPNSSIGFAPGFASSVGTAAAEGVSNAASKMSDSVGPVVLAPVNAFNSFMDHHFGTNFSGENPGVDAATSASVANADYPGSPLPDVGGHFAKFAASQGIS